MEIYNDFNSDLANLFCCVLDRPLDKAIDDIKKKHGSLAVHRASFLHSGLKPMTGGTGEEVEYPVMSSLL
ncbi:DNA polymerase IV [Desulfitobacterium sp. AusDCA]